MLVYLVIEEIRIARNHDKSRPLLEGWICDIEVGMIYRKGNQFYRLETPEDVEAMREPLLAGRIINLNDDEKTDAQPRVVKVHIVQEGKRPKRGDYFWNPLGGGPELYKPGVDYGVFDPGKSSYDDKVVLLHSDMKDPLATANMIVAKDVKYFDDRNKFEAKIKDGEVILL